MLAFLFSASPVTRLAWLIFACLMAVPLGCATRAQNTNMTRTAPEPAGTSSSPEGAPSQLPLRVFWNKENSLLEYCFQRETKGGCLKPHHTVALEVSNASKASSERLWRDLVEDVLAWIYQEEYSTLKVHAIHKTELLRLVGALGTTQVLALRLQDQALSEPALRSLAQWPSDELSPSAKERDPFEKARSFISARLPGGRLSQEFCEPEGGSYEGVATNIEVFWGLAQRDRVVNFLAIEAVARLRAAAPASGGPTPQNVEILDPFAWLHIHVAALLGGDSETGTVREARGERHWELVKKFAAESGLLHQDFRSVLCESSKT